MRVSILLVLSLALAGIVAAPTAAAEPCEVPGCNVAGAALCVATNAKQVGSWKTWLPECLTQPA